MLDEVERGDTIVITGRGRPIARLVPETASRQVEIRRTIEKIKAFRRKMPQLPASEIRALIDEGRK